jgi:hypothetical protein
MAEQLVAWRRGTAAQVVAAPHDTKGWPIRPAPIAAQVGREPASGRRGARGVGCCARFSPRDTPGKAWGGGDGQCIRSRRCRLPSLARDASEWIRDQHPAAPQRGHRAIAPHIVPNHRWPASGGGHLDRTWKSTPTPWASLMNGRSSTRAPSSRAPAHASHGPARRRLEGHLERGDHPAAEVGPARCTRAGHRNRRTVAGSAGGRGVG